LPARLPGRPADRPVGVLAFAHVSVLSWSRRPQPAQP